MTSDNNYYFHCNPYHFGKVKGNAQTWNKSEPENSKETDQVFGYLKRGADHKTDVAN